MSKRSWEQESHESSGMEADGLGHSPVSLFGTVQPSPPPQNGNGSIPASRATEQHNGNNDGAPNQIPTISRKIKACAGLCDADLWLLETAGPMAGQMVSGHYTASRENPGVPKEGCSSSPSLRQAHSVSTRLPRATRLINTSTFSGCSNIGSSRGDEHSERTDLGSRDPTSFGGTPFVHAFHDWLRVYVAKLATAHGDQLIEKGMVVDLTSRLAALYRSISVGKFHLMNLMADGLDKVIVALQNSLVATDRSEPSSIDAGTHHFPPAAAVDDIFLDIDSSFVMG
ncbi:uncharacterized protein PG986_007736 [Apiospora aurea]|uniref:Uncharacterized protein n=1 Tax=Apiospora aurea TaxID=335848 RepID=A0ABR1QDQ5_9PEZI